NVKWKSHRLRIARVETVADLAILTLTLYLLKGPGGSYSATSFVALVVGTAGYFWFAARKRSALARSLVGRLVALPAICLGVAIPFLGATPVLPALLEMLGRDRTFTGRTDIWSLIVPIACGNPFLGLGYGGFWIDPPLREPFNRLTHSHNGYLEV